MPREPLSSIAVPTLVIHGTADPMFPLEHGEALAEEIPGARLLTLEGAGHGVDRADWETIVRRDPRAHRPRRSWRSEEDATMTDIEPRTAAGKVLLHSGGLTPAFSRAFQARAHRAPLRSRRSGLVVDGR